MARFYVELPEYEMADNPELEEIVLTGSDVNHIKNVLRMKEGEQITVCTGRGWDYLCTLHTITSESVTARINQRQKSNTELPVKLYLFQALPKTDKMEYVIQKAVELGVSEIIPVAMKRCVVKIEDKKKEQKKLERWRTIAEAAAKQSGRGIIPSIHEVLNFSQAVEYAGQLETILLPYEAADGMQGTGQHMEHAIQTNSIGIFIGPEGGFEREEVDKAEAAGAKIISLGKRILRTETAGMAVLSILMFQIELNR